MLAKLLAKTNHNQLLKATFSTLIKLETRNLFQQSKKNYTMSTMKGILISEFGSADVCKYRTDLPIPEPNENQVQVRVHSVGVNPVDTYVRSGTHALKPKLPYIPGNDSAGIVTKVGQNVKKFQVGDRVFSVQSASGAYAEYSLFSPDRIFKLPDNLSFEEGSAIGVPYFTAYRALFVKANAKPSETVLIHGASGSVGIACIQIAKAHGMKVIGTAGTETGLKLIKGIGADYVYNHREIGYLNEIAELFPNGVDVLLEMSAHINLNQDLQLLAFKKGRLVIIGARGPIEINPRLIMSKETTVTGVMLFASTDDDFVEASASIESLIKLNVIKPHIGKMYSLEQTYQAHHDVINNSGTMGRLALQID